MRILRLPRLIGFSTFCWIWERRCWSFLSWPGVTFSISRRRDCILKRSASRSCFHEMRSISARAISAFPPREASLISGRSSSSGSKSSSRWVTKLTSVDLPDSKPAILVRISSLFLASFPSVIRKEWTELSRRFRRLTVIRALIPFCCPDSETFREMPSRSSP